MLSSVLLAAALSGEKILDVYSTDFSVDYKEDNLPLTLADTRPHEVISSRFACLFPDIPIISEEGTKTSYEDRKNMDRFWLVDPLDGTKNFIKKNGEFTVNIALVENNKPVLGMVYIPASGTVYYSDGKNV